MNTTLSAIHLPHIPEIDRNRCNGCGLCAARCPTHAVAVRDGYAVIVNADAGNLCPLCEKYCPTGAIGRPFTITFCSATTT
ncbi:MAG: ATP-binding protein [Chloroflexus sp.]|uniref:ATP-binding protein n=1 Tax=Chloroflexus sp. TaxID=1904827 RepID=UPI00404AF99A